MEYTFNLPPTKFSKLLRRELRLEIHTIDFCGSIVNRAFYKLPNDSKAIKINIDAIPASQNEMLDGGEVFHAFLIDYKTENKTMEIELFPEEI